MRLSPWPANPVPPDASGMKSASWHAVEHTKHLPSGPTIFSRFTRGPAPSLVISKSIDTANEAREQRTDTSSTHDVATRPNCDGLCGVGQLFGAYGAAVIARRRRRGASGRRRGRSITPMDGHQLLEAQRVSAFWTRGGSGRLTHWCGFGFRCQARLYRSTNQPFDTLGSRSARHTK